ncbi:MAG: UvrD-helicase domain-containing protein [Blastocatellia bacterium]|nr:UvrD-helicase domain-containing protein [Blastocatellia bacterium]
MDAIAEDTYISHYRIISPLGAGGMGAVYKAYDEKLDRIVALKVLPPDSVSREDRRQRFLQEARAASNLTHPHILTIYEVGEVEGTPFIAMEYIQGDTLRRRIQSRKFSITDALSIAIQIADGLAKAHEHGIVHRDLKPENLMISRDGYAKILDFGLAKLTRRNQTLAAASDEKTQIQVKTRAGTIMGTINYMSPEQILGRRIDHRSDIFSFGIVLYEMATGRPPFAAENDVDTMHAILHEEAKPLHEVKTGLPRDLQPIVDRALAKEARKRYQSIRELASDLKQLKLDLELGKARPAGRKTRLVLRPVAPPEERATKIDYEKELNEAQYQAVTTIDGPLLIVAGAGTGKTRTLIYRVARLVETGVAPEAVLLLTFTRRAAASMLARAAALADERCHRVSGGTFHSMASQTLRRYSNLAGVMRSFTVLDQSDTEDLIDLFRRQMGLTTKDRRFPRKHTIGSIISMAANKSLSIEEVLDRNYPQFAHERLGIEELAVAFEEYRRERHLFTYDDLLVRLRDTLQENEDFCAKLSNQYRYIMVDEYQDTNRLQAEIVRLMARTHENVAVVGDESQAIYSFRGASFKNMLEFPDFFPSARVIKLEENFRSTQPILDAANSIILNASEGYSKRLFSEITEGPLPMLVSARNENEQSQFVVQHIEELLEEGVPLDEIAVLFRAGSHSFDLEIELDRQGIPFRKFGGVRLSELAHVKDMLSFLRVVSNPSDTLSWMRLLKLIDNIGDATAEQILAHLGIGEREFQTARAKDGLFKELKEYPARPNYSEQLSRLARLLRKVGKLREPEQQLEEIEDFYREILQARYDDYPRRERDLEHLVTIAKRYRKTEELLADIIHDRVDPRAAEAAEEQGAVTLSTVHSAKGLEWDSVFVIWVMDGWFPSSRAFDRDDDLEEERRLFYVAATRAKRHLYFVYPLNASASAPTVREGGVTSSFSIASRFLEPVPSKILPRATLVGEASG